ncbi:MAG TPA: CHAP domain-containing protein [Candidatus Saccharibacteria bacterium]|nr:CHAP domain-containing protein [Candidatus Saccharibacteria bacterium]HRK94363.1 CHAP domain-containing protein [Candidatus Saccharibacteria bacterium]
MSEQMKLRSTTPSSKSLKARLALILVAGVMAATAPLAFMPTAKADKYDEQIAALQREIDRYQAAANKLDAKADTLQRRLDGIKSEIAQLQAKIKLNEAKYNQLVAKIEETKKQIEENKIALGEVIADLGIEGKVTPLEMLASSKNIGDYVDKQTYQESMQDELNATIKRINELKQELEKQKESLEAVLENQKRDRAALDQKRATQQQLVNETRGQERAYQQLRNRSKAEQLRVMEAQQAAIAAASANNGGVRFVGGSSGGYPWHSGNCYVDGNAMSYGGADGNGGDGWGYGCRQCASYAAWKIGQHTGTIPTYAGNANNFPGSFSYRPQGSTARANSVGVIMAGAYGHVVWVESGPDAAGFITVSQYNANYGGGWGNFSRVRVHQSTYDVFIYF